MAIQYYADQDVKGNITLGGNLIFDTGGNALITTSGGDLTLQTSTDDIFLIAQDDISLAVNGGDVGVYISGGGGTSLRYNNSQKLITTNAGVNIGFPTSAGGVLNTAGQLYIEHQGTAWNETTPGTARGAIHMDPVGSGGDDTGNAITFGASDHSGGTVSDAGIYVRSDGNYGTKMYIATTDSYSLGSKTAITIQQTGAVAINRSHLTISTITNSSSDTDKFLVSNSGQVQYRTGAQVLADIGGAPATGGSYLPLSAGGSYPLTAGLYIPNYIYHNGDTGTNIGYPSVGRFTIATGSATRADFTNAGFSLGDYQTNVSANIILDEDNMGSNSATALVTQQSVKAYVDAHTSGIGGSGTTNFIPMFTAGTTIGNSAMSQANIGTGNAKRISVTGARMTITGNGGDADGGTLNLSSNTARLGIATNSITGGEPEASLDVGKNARVRGSLNVGPTTEQYLFVSTTGDNPVGYVKMGYYGSGVEWGSSTSTTRTPQYSTGFGSGGKVVEDARYYTFKISFANMASIDTTPRVLIAQDTGPYTYIVEDFYVFQDNASSGNSAPIFNSDLRLDYKWTPTVGTARTSTAWVVPQATINRDANVRTRRTLMQGVSAQTLSISGAGLQEGSGTAYARASVILAASSVTSTSSSGDYYLRLKVKKINITNDILNNTETITIT